MSVVCLTMVNQVYKITYQMPYNNCEWRFKEFASYEEAKRMVEFYQNCGSPARLVERYQSRTVY